MRSHAATLVAALLVVSSSADAWAQRAPHPAAGSASGIGPALGPTSNRSQVIAEAERMRAGFGVRPAPGWHFDDVARRRAVDSFSWLVRTGRYYRHDPLVSAALMRTYGVLGDYYVGYHPAGAWRAYAAANWWARRSWWYYERTAELQRAMDLYALSWAGVAAPYGTWYWRPDAPPEGAEAQLGDPGNRETALEPVAVPEIDETTLTSEQRKAWKDVRTQFVFISSRVHQARVNLDEVTQRLSAQGMTLNARDGATAISMQSFLVDAADLAQEHEFERAMEALKKADYERGRLRNVTGR